MENLSGSRSNSYLINLAFYTGYLAQRLREGERNKALLLFNAYRDIFGSENVQADNPELGHDLEKDLSLPLSILEANKDIPIMVANEAGEVLYATNFGEDLDTNATFLQQKLVSLKSKGPEPTPIPGTDQYLFYENSRLHQLLTYSVLIV